VANEGYSMNKQRERHMFGAKEGEAGNEKDAGDVKKKTGQHHAPHIHIHSHAKGHTVHVMHHDGAHEKHEHAHGDVEGMKAHLDKHFGAGGEHNDEGDQFESGDLLGENEGLQV
jgi:hypothetical protein